MHGEEPRADGKKKTNTRKDTLLIDAAALGEVPQYDAFINGDHSPTVCNSNGWKL